jgi:hypothetical protein
VLVSEKAAIDLERFWLWRPRPRPDLNRRRTGLAAASSLRAGQLVEDGVERHATGGLALGSTVSPRARWRRIRRTNGGEVLEFGDKEPLPVLGKSFF